jgi:MYXO-CTERM domain-containing protein
VVSKLMLEIHDPANCNTTLADLASFPGFGYDAHYCSVDNPDNARLAACGHFQAGLRVFDIGDPANPKEIAYYKPPARRLDYKAGSNINLPLFGARFDHTADWASANSRFVWHGSELHIWFTSQDNGFQVVRFTNGVGTGLTNLDKGGGCSSAGSSFGALLALGLLPLLRRRRCTRRGTG